VGHELLVEAMMRHSNAAGQLLHQRTRATMMPEHPPPPPPRHLNLRQRHRLTLMLCYVLMLVALVLTNAGTYYANAADTETLGMWLLVIGIIIGVLLAGGLLFGVIRTLQVS
jgi:hypothetical protein